MTQQKHIGGGGILSSHFLDCVPKAVHSPQGYHQQQQLQQLTHNSTYHSSALHFNTSDKVNTLFPPSTAATHNQHTNILYDTLVDNTASSTSPASPSAALKSKIIKKEKKLDEKGEAKVKRSRHMPLACPFHYLSHTRCDTKTCSTRKLYSKTNSPLHDYQYRTLKTLYSNHKPHRTMFMKRVKVLFRQHAPNGQKAFEELLKELKQNHIVDQSEIDHCIQQEQEQLQQKRKSPKPKKKTGSQKASSALPTQPLSKVKKQSKSQVNAVGTKRKAISEVIYEYRDNSSTQHHLEQPIDVKTSILSSGSVALADEEDFSDFDPAMFTDYGRTYNLRNKRRRIDDSSEEESESSLASSVNQEESDYSIPDDQMNSVTKIQQEPKIVTPNLMWYEYDADQCEAQVLVKSSNGDWIVQENGGEKYADSEDDEESNVESDDEEQNASYHHHDYMTIRESPSPDFPLTHEIDVAELLIDMMNTE